MKKRNIFFSLVLVGIASVAALSGCGKGGDKPDFMKPVTANGYFRPHRGEWYSTYRALRLNGGQGYSNENYSEIVDVDYDYTYQAVTDVKAFVVPVDFVGYEAANLPKGAEGTKEDLRKAVFGRADETNWNSLKSYYDAVSFGQCQVDGVVADWFHTNVTPNQFKKGDNFGPNKQYIGASGSSAVRALIRAIQDHYFGEGSQYNLADFDGNGDMVLDSLLIIYSCPPKVDGSTELFWAFCGDSDAGTINRYFWASYETFWEYDYDPETKTYKRWTKQEIAEGIAKIDCHTLIHEFGHVIGAPDYYDYDYSGNNPLGGVDMMDYNVGDHNSLTKGWYGWVAPYVVEDNCSITINSTTDTGDFIIVPLPGKWYEYGDKENRWDGTLLDQFLIIEFITPTGVVAQEADHSYDPNYPTFYSQPAIRILHADARIGQFDYDSNFKGYTAQTKITVSGLYLRTAATNTGGKKADTKTRGAAFFNDRLLTLLSSEPTRRTWQLRGADNGHNQDLWETGDVLSGYKFFGRTGIQDTDLPFNIEIKAINGMKNATIQFTRTDK